MKQDASRIPRLEFFLSGLIFLFFLVLYFFSTNQIFSFDAVTNAIACESIEKIRWFHPNHLFYPFAGVFYYKFERVFGYTGLSLYSLARFNSILTSAGLAIYFYSLSNRVGKSVALLTTLFLGFTFSVWHYAVDGRAVGASVIFSILVVRQLMRMDAKRPSTFPDIAWLSIFSTATILFHGISIFHVPAVALFIYEKSESREAKLKLSLLYGMAVLGLLGIFYAPVYFYINRLSPVPFTQWVLGYAGFNGAPKALEAGFWVHRISEFFLGLWTGWAYALIAGKSNLTRILSHLFAISFLTYLIFKVVQKGCSQNLIRVLVLWGFFVTIFLAFWSPGQEGFRLHVIVPWLTAFVLLAHESRVARWFLVLAAAACFVINFTTAIYPAAFIQNNVGYQLLSEARAQMNPGDVIVAARAEALPGIEVLRPYFFPEISGGTIDGRLFAFHETRLDPLKENLKASILNGNNVFMTDDVFDDSVGFEIERHRGLRPGEMGEFRKHFNPVSSFTLSNKRHLYRVGWTD